jgi:uncharacterized protein (TIGR00251 family)
MPVSPRGDGVRLRLYIQPRASRTELAGLHGEAIRIRLAAPPVDGAANEELVRFLARQLGVRQGDVSVVSGLAGRRKTVDVRSVTVKDARRCPLEP